MIYSKFIKRVLDFTGSLLLLIILSPILLIVALMVKIRLGSPVIFKQQRLAVMRKYFQSINLEL